MEDAASLARLLFSLTSGDGHVKLGDSGVTLVRQSNAPGRPQQGVFHSAVCLVAQGAKRVWLDQNVFDYDESNLIVSTVDVPVAYQLLRARPEAPFLCVTLVLDPARIAAATLKVFPQGVTGLTTPAMGVAPTDPGIIDTAYRLVRALSDPSDAGLVSSLVYEELLIRLLRSPLGPRIARVGTADSGLFGVARAIDWLRSHFADPITTEDLARLAHMSVSSFHAHFRAVTTQSPLQYQKALRLQEARSLMLTKLVDSGTAGHRVGYVSRQQFSREYSRYFGQSPTKDMALLR